MTAIGNETSRDLRMILVGLFVGRKDDMRPTYNTDIPVNSGNALVGVLLHKFACDELLHCQNNAILASNADRGTAVLYSLSGVLDLEVAAIGGEDGVGKIVAGAY